MRNIQDYLEAARYEQHLGSDRQLAKLLEISSSAMNAIRLEKNLPSPETMVRIAGLARISKEQALLELSYWSAENEETRMVYKELMRKVSGVLTVLIIVFSALFLLHGNAEAATGTHHSFEYVNIPYHTKRRKFWRKIKAWFQGFFTPPAYAVV